MLNNNQNEILKYINTIDNLHHQIDNINDQNHKNIDNIINSYENNLTYRENYSLKNKVDDMDHELITKTLPYTHSISDKINNLDSKFQNFIDKFSKNNIDKGNFGEKFISDYLKDKFFNSQIIDTHKETSSGDMFFIYNSLTTLIESKNVQTLKKDDFKKFYHDIELRSNNNEINSAIFISLTNSNLINNNKYFVLDFKFNIPIIYISHVFNNPEFIRFSIIIIENLIKNMNTNKYNNKIQNIISQIEIISNMIASHFDFINSDKKLISKLQININNREKDLIEINSKIIKIINYNYDNNTIDNNNINNNTIDTNNNTIDNDDKLNKQYIENIIKHINNNNNFKINIKNLNSIGINKNIIIQLGGIKNINKLIKDFKNIIL